MKLTVRQQKFADEYIISGNAIKAAIKAGYNKKTARAVGAENLTKPNISEYINKRLEKLKEERLMSIEETLIIYASIARGEEQNALTKIFDHYKQ